MVQVLSFEGASLKQIRNELMKKTLDVKSQLELAIAQAQKDINAYQREIEMKVKELSKRGIEQVDQAIDYIKSQEFANTLMQSVEDRVEPLRSDLKNKEQIIRQLVDTILNRAKEVRENLVKDPIGEVQTQLKKLKAHVLKKARKPKKRSSSKSTTKKSTTAKKTKSKRTAKR